MKKLLTTIIFISYFIASSGATIHVHYCMGRAVEFDLGKHSFDETCLGCGMMTKDKKGCCNDKETTIRITGSYQHSVSDFDISSVVFSTPVFPLVPKIISYGFVSKPEFFQSNFSPQKTLSRHILNCMFLI